MPEVNDKTIFPYQSEKERLNKYEYHKRIQEGKHFEAFNIKVDSEKWSKEYGKLRYVVANYAGLISKVVADMLFSEPPKIATVEGRNDGFITEVLKNNKMEILNYETALRTSALGDGLYKMRYNKRRQSDEELDLIIEYNSPSIWFPELDKNNANSEPDVEELAWMIKINDQEYLRKEIHKPFEIENQLFLLKDEKIHERVPLSFLGEDAPEEIVPTGVPFNLLNHIPNFRYAGNFYGESDYSDLVELMFALNNRITKIDNILDKHSDPILALPEGILDKNGRIKRGNLQMFEKPEGTTDKPEYVIWNASLEAAFDEIEKLTEMLFMFSEISPDVLGMGNGKQDSGRALKLRLLRTIAKVRRKRVYFNDTLKTVLYNAQVFAKNNNIKVNGVGVQGEPEEINIEWQDGLPVDEYEQVQIEEMRVSAGLTTKADAIARIDGVDEETAAEKAKEIDDANKLQFEGMQFNNLKDKDADSGRGQRQ